MRFEVGRELAGSLPIPIFKQLGLATTPERIRENIRSAVGRGLPVMWKCNSHAHVMSIVGGGPSLEDTYRDLTGYVVAANKAHDWLLSRGVVPRACGLMDAVPILADAITPHKDVTYFVASMCDPAVFDKLKGCHVVLWHASQPDMDDSDLTGNGALWLGGGSTISLRLINVGYHCGFRSFHLHGMDSSFRAEKTHAYEYIPYQMPGRVNIYGHETTLALLPQVAEFYRFLKHPEIAACKFTMHGDGLLQETWRRQGYDKPKQENL